MSSILSSTSQTWIYTHHSLLYHIFCSSSIIPSHRYLPYLASFFFRHACTYPTTPLFIITHSHCICMSTLSGIILELKTLQKQFYISSAKFLANGPNHGGSWLMCPPHPCSHQWVRTEECSDTINTWVKKKKGKIDEINHQLKGGCSQGTTHKSA